jgi:hypothetical protein
MTELCESSKDSVKTSTARQFTELVKLMKTLDGNSMDKIHKISSVTLRYIIPSVTLGYMISENYIYSVCILNFEFKICKHGVVLSRSLMEAYTCIMRSYHKISCDIPSTKLTVTIWLKYFWKWCFFKLIHIFFYFEIHFCYLHILLYLLRNALLLFI